MKEFAPHWELIIHFKTNSLKVWEKKRKFYFIVSGEISVYLVKIKYRIISFVTVTIYIFTPRFGRLRFFSLFQKWMLPPLQNFEHL